MFTYKKIATLTIAAFLLDATPTIAADSPLTQRLLDQAQYWQQRGRDDLAAESWRKLLSSDPANADALASMGMYEAEEGRTSPAKAYLDKLRQAHPAHPGIRGIELALKEGKKGRSQLEEARRLGQSGQPEAAVERYKTVIGTGKLTGDVALEYYQTMAATKDGWDDARKGLEQLVKDNPENSRYLLALAQHLTYRESARREGIRILSVLSNKAETGKQAESMWRQALIWLNAKSTDIGLLQAWLSHHTDDSAIRDKLESLTKANVPSIPNTGIATTSPANRNQALAYEALDVGDLATSESHFQQILKDKPNEADALGGLGLVRLKQQSFSAARDLLAQAMKSAPSKRNKWTKAHASASFWALVREAEAARSTKLNDRAEVLLRQAIRLDPAEPIAQVGLADVLAERGNLSAAEMQYRHVLKATPHNDEAIRGLINVLSQSKRQQEALALADKLTEPQRAKLGSLGSIRSNALRAQAQAAQAAGNNQAAQAALEEGLLIDPSNPWLRLDLSRIYQRRGMPAQARSLIDSLLVSGNPMPEAIYVSALLSAEQEQWWEGLTTLEKVPVSARTKDMAALQRRLWTHVQVSRAAVYAQQGNAKMARDILAQVELAADNDAQLLGAIAASYADIGDFGRGLSIMRQALSQSSKPSSALRLQYAGVLLKTRQDAELEPLLRQISGVPDLTRQEHIDYNNLRIALALRQADAAREAGDLEAAYDYIAPAFHENPADARLIMAVARMYTSAGDPSQAITLYQTVLQSEPDNLDASQAAVGAAIDLKDYEFAEGLISDTMRRHPDNPRVIAVAGRVARAQGNVKKALEYLQLAQQLEGKIAQAGSGVQGLRLINEEGAMGLAKEAMNPFASRASGPAASARLNAQSSYSGDNKSVGRPVLVPVALPAKSPVLTPVNVREDRQITSAAPLARDTQQHKFKPELPAQGYTLPTAELAQPSRQQRRNNNGYAEQTLQQEIDEIKAKNSSSVTGGPIIRVRSGETGMNELVSVETPTSLNLNSLGNNGQLSLKVAPVLLTAGTPDLTKPDVLGRFGSNPQRENNPSTKLTDPDQSAAGLALGLAYELGSGLRADVGVSPLGFEVTNVVGGVSWNKSDNGINFGLDLSRRSVKDSLLSYAGTIDNLGMKWGGVTSTGARVNAGFNNDEVGFYSSTGYRILEGKNVASNRLFELGGGVYWHAYKSTEQRLTVGVDVNTQFYEKNLRYFTLGQGGYFSPQRYFAFGFPVDFAGRSGKVAYQVGGSVGVQNFTEDASPYFPADAARQRDYEAKAAASSQTIETKYAGQNHTGIQFKLYGALEYQISPKWFFGGRLSAERSRDYTEGIGQVYFRYSLEPQVGMTNFPPLTPFKAN